MVAAHLVHAACDLAGSRPSGHRYVDPLGDGRRVNGNGAGPGRPIPFKERDPVPREQVPELTRDFSGDGASHSTTSSAVNTTAEPDTRSGVALFGPPTSA
jgi:hypothetical protein